MIAGMCSTDVGRYDQSLELLENSVKLAQTCANGRQLAYSLSWLGRARLLRRELGEARRSLERALSVCRSQGWLWITALPESFLGEVEMLQGNMEAAGHTLEHAFAMACQVGDVCFESLAARALGLLEARRGDMDAAVQRLENTRIQVFAAPDYTWSMAYVLDALCATAVEARTGPAAGWINDLESLGGHTGMREFVARAYLHRTQHGDENALEAARLIATEIDNPHLHALLASPPAVARTAAL
jgi:tetratricopeptide (TPR) repeat protein